MLLILQFPIADSRLFCKEKCNRLSRPSWPEPVVGSDFVRSIGGVHHRPLGGIGGEYWESEKSYCDAKGLVKFQNTIYYPGTNESIGVDIVFRRLYFDGRAAAKIEIGFKISRILREVNLDIYCKTVLNTMITVPPAQDAKVGIIQPSKLILAGTMIARGYCLSTTKHSAVSTPKFPWGVNAGQPLVIAETSSADTKLMHGSFDLANLSIDSASFKLYHATKVISGITYRLWILNRIGAGRGRKDVRNLRLWLSRIHAEKETIHTLFRSIADGRLDIPVRGEVSDLFQRYLVDAIKKLNHYGNNLHRHHGNEIESEALRLETIAHPGYIKSIITAFEAADIRPSVKKKILEFVHKQDDRSRTQIQFNINRLVTMEATVDNRQYQANVIGTGNTVIVANSIDNIFNKLSQSAIPDNVGIELEKIRTMLKELLPKLTSDQDRQAVQDDTDSFLKEATKPNPRKNLLEITGEGLVKAAQICAEIASPLASSVRTIIALLTGSLQ